MVEEKDNPARMRELNDIGISVERWGVLRRATHLIQKATGHIFVATDALRIRPDMDVAPADQVETHVKRVVALAETREKKVLESIGSKQKLLKELDKQIEARKASLVNTKGKTVIKGKTVEDPEAPPEE